MGNGKGDAFFSILQVPTPNSQLPNRQLPTAKTENNLEVDRW
jgi:hypothetical protein